MIISYIGLLFILIFNMSDNTTFTDEVLIAPRSPHLSKSFMCQSKIALNLSVTNKFLKQLSSIQNETDLSYVAIVNSQIDGFELIETDRLNNRFWQISHRTSNQLKTKFRSGRKRDVFLNQYITVAVFDDELTNIKTLNCQLRTFKKENVEREQRCSDLFVLLKNATITENDMRLENCSLLASERSKSNENVKLKKDNLVLQKQVDSQRSLITNLEEEADSNEHIVSALYDTNLKLQKENDNLQRGLSECKTPVQKQVGESKSKKASLQNVGDNAKRALWFLEQFGLTPKVLKCQSASKKNVDVSLSYQNIDGDDKENVRKILYIMDKFAISEQAYHEMSSLSFGLPPKTTVRKEKMVINEKFSIFRCPGQIPGAYVTLQSELDAYVRASQIEPESILKVKVSGDGTNVSRVSNFVTLSISFPDRDCPLSEQYIKTLAIVKCKETYEQLSVACDPIFSEINEFIQQKYFMTDGVKYNLQITFGGDMKFIQICQGMNGSTSTYSCPWCTVSKSDRIDISKDIDFFDKLKRTVSSNLKNCASSSFGLKKSPLILIEADDIVPDELHILLRICDVLLSNLIDDCRQADSRLEVIGQKPHHVDGLVTQIRECGVSFSTWTDKSSSELKWSSLTGTDYRKLLVHLPEKLLFIIQNETHDDVIYLWHNLYAIYLHINKDKISKLELFAKIKKWMTTFLGLSKKGRLGYNRITPYMHCLMFHVPSIIENHGLLQSYSGQGVEKLNDSIKTIHQKSSNKLNQSFDELQIRKRIEFLHSHGYERSKRSYCKSNSQFWEIDIKQNRSAKKKKLNKI